MYKTYYTTQHILTFTHAILLASTSALLARQFARTYHRHHSANNVLQVAVPHAAQTLAMRLASQTLRACTRTHTLRCASGAAASLLWMCVTA